jgi:hypothetical protein
MQQVTITTTFWRPEETDTGVIIANMDDFREYFDLQSKELFGDFKNAIINQIPKERWDHLSGKLGVATNISKIKETNPLIEACDMLDKKGLSVLNILVSGLSVFINESGGAHAFSDDTHTILESQEFTRSKNKKVVIAKNPSFINLENDPKPENHTIEYFKSQNLEPSYIFNLRNFDKEDLIDVFSEFTVQGGHGVYIYTTAMDVEQMAMYCDAIIASDFNSVIFHFNSEIDGRHEKIISKLKEHGIDVERNI